jgi:hypothetical protein
MPSVEEVKLHVAASIQQTEAAAVGVRAVLEKLDESLARLQLTTVGSVHPTVAQALVRLEAARTQLLEAETLIRGAMDAADQYRAII